MRVAKNGDPRIDVPLNSAGANECSRQDCKSLARAKGLCKTHYERQRRGLPPARKVSPGHQLITPYMAVTSSELRRSHRVQAVGEGCVVAFGLSAPLFDVAPDPSDPITRALLIERLRALHGDPTITLLPYLSDDGAEVIWVIEDITGTRYPGATTGHAEPGDAVWAAVSSGLEPEVSDDE